MLAFVAITFFPLLHPPQDESKHREYLEALDVLTANLPPILLCRATNSVVTPDL
jgi:hypothetical protein